MKARRFYQWQGPDLILHCQAQANASNNAFAEVIENRLKIRIQAPAIDGKANKALIAFLAKSFGCAKSNITLIKGDTQKLKTFLITSPAQLPAINEGISIERPAVS